MQVIDLGLQRVCLRCAEGMARIVNTKTCARDARYMTRNRRRLCPGAMVKRSAAML